MNAKNKQRAKLALAELEKEMEILAKEEMSACRGGGDGSQSNPYSWREYETLIDNPSFNGGWVRDVDGNIFYGLSSVTIIGGSSRHWEKEGKYDMNNCYDCMCGELAKPAPGDPKLRPYFGQLILHQKYHRDDYYRYYGACD